MELQLEDRPSAVDLEALELLPVEVDLTGGRAACEGTCYFFSIWRTFHAPEAPLVGRAV